MHTHPHARLRALAAAVLLALAALVLPSDLRAEAAGGIVQFDIAGAIGPATADFAVRSLERAEREQARLVLIRLDTPGGLDTAMRAIIKAILASPVPVAGYVAPGGARAASAGTYILFACPVAAMAPGTNLGAATPVNLGGPAPEPPPPKGGKTPPEPADAHTRKQVNDAVAYIRGLAKLRGRNAEWAEKAVREAASLPADEALAAKVIDLIATDVPDLLAKLEGREVRVLGRELTLHLAGLPVTATEPDWRSRFLAAIADPNLAYILLLVGFYGLVLEFTHPGTVAPGTIGIISLLLALYAFQVLPVDYAGLGLLLLGLALMFAEAFVPSFGALGIGGAVAFVFGSLMLMDGASGYGVDPGLVAGFAVSSLLFFGVLIRFALRSRHLPVATGRDEMLGQTAVALADFTGEGKVRIGGEIWNAEAAAPVRRGERLSVTGIQGLTVQVGPLNPVEPP